MLQLKHLLNLQLSPLRILPDEEEILEWFKVLSAGWIYDSNPKKPHALLHSGKHSDGFFLCKKVLKNGNLREILARIIALKVEKKDCRIDAVFGSAYSSITLAADVGRFLGVPNYIPEKDPTDPSGKRMVFKSDDPIPEGARIFQVEELITTFDSAQATKDAIVKGNPFKVEFVPYIATVIHRPPVMRGEYDGRKLIALVNRQIMAWEPKDCPLCRNGSVALAPKTHWAELTA